MRRMWVQVPPGVLSGHSLTGKIRPFQGQDRSSSLRGRFLVKESKVATTSEIADNLLEWLDTVDDVEFTSSQYLDIKEIVYTLNEGNGWPEYGVGIGDTRTVILCWKIVEKMRQQGWMPKEYRI